VSDFCDFPSQRHLVRIEPSPRDGPWEYGWLGRMRFAQDHEVFFRLCLETMRPRDAHLLCGRWFVELTLSDLAASYDITSERVRQIEIKAFRCIFTAIKTMWEGR
jgi:hypothetical protein